jgi:hypothetical protein
MLVSTSTRKKLYNKALQGKILHTIGQMLEKQMKQYRYLTKSRFKLATECPTKLYYTGKKEYLNQKYEDSFLLALAEGGFQVGELAKLYFPGGHDITTLEYDEAVQQTNIFLSKEKAVIYEGAIQTDNLFIRADILIKKGNQLDLIEVKSKSFDKTEDDPFYNKDGSIKSAWKPYLYDVAFQKHVIERTFPTYHVNAYLMLADKTALCPTDGLNQKFRIVLDKDGRKSVTVSPKLSQDDLSTKLLCKVNVDEVCDQIFTEPVPSSGDNISFAEWITILSDKYQRNIKIDPIVSTACGKCEFIAQEAERAAGLKSGFHECWSLALGWQDDDFKQGTILDIWNYRKKDRLIEDNRLKLSEVTEEDISPSEDGKPGLSASERQWLQVQKVQDNDDSLWIDKDGLGYEMSKWNFPLHFIDFETTMVAIPFNKGRRPYEGIAFQFSHHTVTEGGEINHGHEYLNVKPGEFPSYDFVRNLMAALNQDNGSIFRYSPHENTFLNIIYWQLVGDTSYIHDRKKLLDFIISITKSTNDSIDQWEGKRSMIDLWLLVKRYYYDPRTKGSNSIKQILPSILNRSNKLKEKYSQPIYGAKKGITSLNFTDWTWVQFDGDTVIDPYKLLPKMFQDVPEEEVEFLTESSDLREGGAAMTAYARMQFEEMSNYERGEIRKALLKYCELDTLAMAMIYEGWQDLIFQ